MFLCTAHAGGQAAWHFHGRAAGTACAADRGGAATGQGGTVRAAARGGSGHPAARQRRPAATRRGKLARSFVGVPCLAATMDRIKPRQSLVLPASGRARLCSPCLDGLGPEPDRQIAMPAQDGIMPGRVRDLAPLPWSAAAAVGIGSKGKLASTEQRRGKPSVPAGSAAPSGRLMQQHVRGPLKYIDVNMRFRGDKNSNPKQRATSTR